MAKRFAPSAVGAETVAQLEEDLFRLVEQADPSFARMVVSFEGIQFLSSRVLGVFVAVYRSPREKGLQMAFCRLGPEVARLFQLTRLDQLIPVYASAGKTVADKK